MRQVEESEELDPSLQSALKAPNDDEAAPDVLAGFQRKLRARSGGKFYADGWSTAHHPPINTYLITSLLMLAIIGVIYALLAPISGEPLPRDNRPAPVQIISPSPPAPPLAPAPASSAAPSSPP